MEYIDGPTVRLLLARSRRPRRPFPIAARIVSSARGLAYAHDFQDWAPASCCTSSTAT